MWMPKIIKRIILKRKLKDLQSNSSVLFSAVSYYYNNDGEQAAEFMLRLDKVKAEIKATQELAIL
jgi:hypothetical protein